jgi:hypothetical protein
MLAVPYWVKIADQVVPPLTDFQMPPDAAPA